MGKGYGQHQRLCVAAVHHQSRVDAQSHDGHEVTRGKQHRGHLENSTRGLNLVNTLRANWI